MSKKCIIMVGASGSGKTTYVRRHYPTAAVVSADLFFEQLAKDTNSTYRDVWDVQLLAMAHRNCQEEFLRLLMSGAELIAVDNTNIRSRDRKIYMILARSFDYDVELVVLPNDLESCYARQQHGVPKERLARQIHQQRLAPGIYRYVNTTEYVAPIAA